ncbi:MAG: radical SAM protein [Victivallaceae bacterium]|nr:radical SAM protein [Victivallaceae bacterium]
MSNILPFEATLTFTYRCNLACPFCYERDSRSAAKNELPLSVWLDFIDEMADLKMFRVRVTGGEPFCHPYFRPMLERLGKRNMRYFIISNGTLITREWADFLAGERRC